MKNNHIIIESSLTEELNLGIKCSIIIFAKKLSIYYIFFSKWMVIEILLNNDIYYFFVQMILNFQKHINVIMHYWSFKKSKVESFHLNKILIRYEFSKFMFF
jgi:hypothetical protein